MKDIEGGDGDSGGCRLGGGGSRLGLGGDGGMLGGGGGGVTWDG